MCAQYEVALFKNQLLAALKLVDATPSEMEAVGRPTVSMPVVLAEAPKTLSAARWGLVPAWAESLKAGAKMFNARAETITEKPSFAPLIGQYRCLIPATSFTEWQVVNGKKVPLRIWPAGLELFTMAGLYTRWQDPASKAVTVSFTILTTSASGQMAAIHNRMPIILSEAQKENWLDPAFVGKELAGLLANPNKPELVFEEQAIAKEPKPDNGQLSLFS
jgi:putative SOS response-associated peptidase YedK